MLILVTGYHSGNFIWANPKISSSFSPILPSLCIQYQPNLWLSGLEHLASYQEVIGLSTRLNFDFFFFQIFKILQIFRHFICFKFSAKSSKAGSFSYQFNNIQSTSSPILKFRLYLAHLFSPSQPLCYIDINNGQKFEICIWFALRDYTKKD